MALREGDELAPEILSHVGGPRPHPLDLTPESVARLSIVVPTRNEAGNVQSLIERTAKSLASLGHPWEIVFVDDSDDGTPEIIRRAAQSHPVHLVHRTGAERTGGLSGAVLRGFEAANGDVLAVMDGDLQHPPEVLVDLVAPLFEQSADLVTATRYGTGGTRTGLGHRWRHLVSRGCRSAVHLLFPRTRNVSDPLGGYFALRRTTLSGASLRPTGFKILLEVLVRGEWRTATEVPYEFEARQSGRSKATLREGWRFGVHVCRLLFARWHAAPAVREQVIDLRDDALVGWGAMGGTSTIEPQGTTLDRLAPITIGGEPLVTGGPTAAAPVVADITAPIAHRPGLWSQPTITVALITVFSAVAYRNSLGSLVSEWGGTSPLAFLVLVPLLSVPLLRQRMVPGSTEPPIHDRQVDYLIGFPLLLAASIVLVDGTGTSAAFFWVHRLDLLTFPLFVAGLVTLLAGFRALLRARGVILFLFLTWPPLARSFFAGPARHLGSQTTSLLKAVLAALGLSATAQHGALRVAVSSSTHVNVLVLSGTGTTPVVVGALLCGIAASLALAGPRTTKVLWVLLGGLLAWVVAFIRITVGAAIGATTGHGWAFGPFSDFATLVVTLALSALVARRLGIARPASPAHTSRGTVLAVPGLALATALTVAVPAAVLQSSISSLSAVAGPLGTPRLVPLSTPLSVPRAPWSLSTAPKPSILLMPSGSRWVGIDYGVRDPVAGGGLAMDVISSSSPQFLGVAAVRDWYGIAPSSRQLVSSVDLGHRTVGHLVRFVDAQGVSWEALTWIWPVAGGDNDRVEQIVILPARWQASVGPASAEEHWLARPELTKLTKLLGGFGRQVVNLELQRTALVPPPPPEVSFR